MLTDKQKKEIYEEAVQTAYSGIVENQDWGWLGRILDEYVKTKTIQEQLLMISSDPVCQKDLLGFDPETGKEWTDDPH